MKALCTLLSLVLLSVLSAQPTLSDEVRENILKRIETGLNPSIAVGLIDADGVNYYSFGKTAADGRNVDEHTLYEIGSIT